MTDENHIDFLRNLNVINQLEPPTAKTEMAFVEKIKLFSAHSPRITERTIRNETYSIYLSGLVGDSPIAIK